MQYVLFKNGLFLKELVSTGSGLRTTTDITKACKYLLLEIAEEDAENFDFEVKPYTPVA